MDLARAAPCGGSHMRVSGLGARGAMCRHCRRARRGVQDAAKGAAWPGSHRTVSTEPSSVMQSSCKLEPERFRIRVVIPVRNRHTFAWRCSDQAVPATGQSLDRGAGTGPVVLAPGLRL